MVEDKEESEELIRNNENRDSELNEKRELLQLKLEELESEIDPKERIKKLEDISKLRAKIKSLGFKNKKNEVKKDNIVETSRVNLNGNIWEQVYNHKTGVCQYVSWDKTNNKYNYAETLQDDEKQLVYITLCQQDDWVKNGYIPLPEKPIDYVSFQNLYDEIQKLIHFYLEVADDREKILAYYTIFSWFIHEVDTCPYLLVIGDPGCGKTRTVDIMKYICYKSQSMLNPRSNHVYRTLEDWKRATLVINEKTDFAKNKDSDKDELLTMYCAGNQSDTPVIRMVDQGNGKYIRKSFCSYGCKIFSNYDEIWHDALNSRCIKIYVKDKTRKEIPLQLGNPFYEKVKKIQGMLLDFQLKNNDNLIFAEFKEEHNSLNNIDNSRVAQVLQPLLILSAFDDKLIPFVKNLAEQQEHNLIEDAILSYRGQVFRAYLDVVNESDNVSAINVANKMNEGITSDKQKVRSDSVGKQLSAMGFSKHKMGKLHYIDKNPKLVKEKLLRYAYPEEREELLVKYGITKEEQQKLKEEYE
ncbi:MAG: hypothetical protein IMZ58_01195 [Thermoplasmata archaeon]|nr:hypothetical protein [Thermoplasmata archaeon]